jgi:two-component system nitrogen regulation response regulator NtrX
MALEILIVDDERDIRELVAGVLGDEGYACRTAADSTEALSLIDERRPSLVLLDVWLHGSAMDGLELLDAIKAREPNLPVIIFSGHGNIDTAVAAVGRGAMDFIEKPFEAERLLLLVERATETERLRRENSRLREGSWGNAEFTGNSPAINAVRATLKRVASTGSRVLISGPAGAGKEVAARLLHAWSARANGAFVLVNSARITPERFEQELFGEEANGKQVRPGLLEMADGGTLYLDEIADMPLSTQARILRVLTDQSFVRVGGTRQIGVDVRVVSSTTRDLTVEMAEKRFREDLFYRLNVVPVVLPSLAQRREDIPALAEHFFTRYSNDQGLAPPEISSEAMAALQAYDWPGNVRQLQSVLFRAAVYCEGNSLTADSFPQLSEMLGEQGSVTLASTHEGVGIMLYTPDGNLRPLEEIEADVIRLAIGHYRGRMTEVARRLGIGRSTLYRKLSDLGIDNAA